MKISLRTLLTITLFIFALTGCATPYQQKSFLMGGYDEVQLGENIFKISFRGNGYTSSGRATDYTLLRSAEVALENGYEYFAIIDEDQSTKQNLSVTQTNVNIVTKPSSSNTIYCYKDKPDEGFAYEAVFVIKSLKQKYGIDT